MRTVDSIGVLCEVVSAVAATEREGLLVKYVHAKLRKVMALVDCDGDHQISKKEKLTQMFAVCLVFFVLEFVLA